LIQLTSLKPSIHALKRREIDTVIDLNSSISFILEDMYWVFLSLSHFNLTIQNYFVLTFSLILISSSNLNPQKSSWLVSIWKDIKGIRFVVRMVIEHRRKNRQYKHHRR